MGKAMAPLIPHGTGRGGFLVRQINGRWVIDQWGQNWSDTWLPKTKAEAGEWIAQHMERVR